MSNNNSKKGPVAIVTKNQQRIKTNYKNSQSEEATINILNLAEALKSRSKKIKANANVENLTKYIKDNSGNDRSWFGGT